MTLKQAIKFLESLDATVFCKYAKSWGEMMDRVPTEIQLAQFIINSTNMK